MFHSNVPLKILSKYVKNVVFLMNWTLSLFLNSNYPFEILYDKISNYTNFRFFGSLCYTSTNLLLENYCYFFYVTSKDIKVISFLIFLSIGFLFIEMSKILSIYFLIKILIKPRLQTSLFFQLLSILLSLIWHYIITFYCSFLDWFFFSHKWY